MRCEHFQRWISDDLDGALPDLKKEKLESHLKNCPDCRAYQKDIVRIQAESGLEEAGRVDADYFKKFTAAIETKLRREAQIRGGALLSWRWAWALAPLVLALVLGIVFLRRGGDGDDVWLEVFSFEGCLERVFQEIGGDDEMAADFSHFLSGSLLEGGEAVVLEDDVDFWKDPLFWRSLSDEDLQSIEDEIKKRIRS